MLSEGRFINEIWDKYDTYNKKRIKESFYEKHLYKNTDYLLAFKTFVMSLILTSTTVGMVYAGVTIYNYIQSSTTTDFENNSNYDDYNQDMTYQNGLYYKKIVNYDDYLNSKNKWNNLVEVTKEDFNDNFLVIIAGENYSTIGLNIYDITADDDTTLIKLKKAEDTAKNTVVSAKISKELERKNISIENMIEKPIVSEYKDLQDIPLNYTKEDAIKDNCFVIEKNQIISSNKDLMEKFFNDSQNNINSMIRVVSCKDDKLKLTDVEYKDGKYLISEDDSRGDTGEKYYNKGSKIKCSTNNGFGYKIYSVEDEVGNEYPICIFK